MRRAHVSVLLAVEEWLAHSSDWRAGDKCWSRKLKYNLMHYFLPFLSPHPYFLPQNSMCNFLLLLFSVCWYSSIFHSPWHLIPEVHRSILKYVSPLSMEQPRTFDVSAARKSQALGNHLAKLWPSFLFPSSLFGAWPEVCIHLFRLIKISCCTKVTLFCKWFFLGNSKQEIIKIYFLIPF